jgi:hypothetical protein
LTSLANILNPAVIIIGDELSTAGEPFIKEVRRTFNSRVTAAVQNSTEIALSNVKEDPWLLGGIQVVIEGHLSMPDFFSNFRYPGNRVTIEAGG